MTVTHVWESEAQVGTKITRDDWTLHSAYSNDLLLCAFTMREKEAELSVSALFHSDKEWYKIIRNWDSKL